MQATAADQPGDIAVVPSAVSGLLVLVNLRV
jgi:hypothetical protein